MTDAHCHVSCGDSSVRELLIGRDFFGMHPWETLGLIENAGPGTGNGGIGQFCAALEQRLRSDLLANSRAGVGEIGLDRLKVRDIPPLMREAFIVQLRLALELRRPVVLHGAKCWGQVVSAIRSSLRTLNPSNPQTFLFHGFSRSDGLIPDIVKLGGFISVGPAVLNDHAVNYRELVKKIPLDRLLIETDRDAAADDGQPTAGTSIADVLAKTAELRGISAADLEKTTDENAEKFMGASL